MASTASTDRDQTIPREDIGISAQKPNRLRSPDGTCSNIASISSFFMLLLRGPGALLESVEVVAGAAGDCFETAGADGGWLSCLTLSVGTAGLAWVRTARQLPASALA